MGHVLGYCWRYVQQPVRGRARRRTDGYGVIVHWLNQNSVKRKRGIFEKSKRNKTVSQNFSRLIWSEIKGRGQIPGLLWYGILNETWIRENKEFIGAWWNE